jgi:uncharacterized protein
MDKLLLLIVAGSLAGWLFEKAGLPGGAIVGAMLGTGLLAVCFEHRIHLSASAGMFIQIILGVSLGLTFDRSFFPVAIKILPLAIVSTLILLSVALLMAFCASKLGIVDFATALFGFSPGGMSGMSVLAQSEGHQTPVVAFLHVVRILTLFIVVPWLGRFFLSFSGKF